MKIEKLSSAFTRINYLTYRTKKVEQKHFAQLNGKWTRMDNDIAKASIMIIISKAHILQYKAIILEPNKHSHSVKILWLKKFIVFYEKKLRKIC